MRKPRPIKERLEAKTMRTRGCWLWTGAVDGSGYGQIYDHTLGRVVKAHRVAFALWVKAIPHGKQVLHSCDVPRCVRPSHLWLGSHADNMRDMFRKGRCKRARGEANYNSKLTAKAVREVRAMRRNGETQQAIANKFGVSQVLISKVLRGAIWAHV